MPASTTGTRRSRRVWEGPVLGVAGILGFLLLWELVPRSGLIEAKYLPPATVVLGRLAAFLGDPAFWQAVGQTMFSWATGLAIASVSAIVIGVVIGTSRLLREATHSTIEFLRPIPSVALIPLVVLLFGFKMQSSVSLIIYACFWQVLIQVLYGTADVDTVARDTARSFRFGRLARLRFVVLPTALPYIMTGLRLAASVALILSVTAELIIGVPGLGKLIFLNQSGGSDSLPAMYALVLAAGLIGVLINLVARATERRILRWHPSVRAEAIA